MLLAFGEMSTFAGALFGIDYKHRLDKYIHESKQSNKKDQDDNDEDN